MYGIFKWQDLDERSFLFGGQFLDPKEAHRQAINAILSESYEMVVVIFISPVWARNMAVYRPGKEVVFFDPQFEQDVS